MSRSELADAVNAAMARLYPADQIAHLFTDSRWVGGLENRMTRWPREPRRAALRLVLGASRDAELGLFKARGGGEIIHDAPAPPADAATSEAHEGAIPPGGRQSASVARAGSGQPRSRGIDTSTPHSARRYNYWLGGKDNFAADRESGDLIAAAFPTVTMAARENRAFLHRAVGYLARGGVRQFLDIGVGLPVDDTVHAIAQRIDPACRVVYVDNDPLVMAHARALMCGDPRGVTDYLEADVRDPAALLAHPALSAVFDRSLPVAVVLTAVLHFVHDDRQAADIVAALLDGLPTGSHLVFSHATTDFTSVKDQTRYEQMFAAGQVDVRARSKAQLSRFLTRLDLVDPGIVAASHWRPDTPSEALPEPADIAIYAAVGRLSRPGNH